MRTEAAHPVPRRRLASGSVAVVGALAVGLAVSLQSRFNGDLAAAGAGVFLASWLCQLGILASLLLVLGGSRRWGSAWHTIRHAGRWWWYAIGLFGITTGLAVTFSVPIIGVSMTSVSLVAGQMLSGLILDARGVAVDTPLRLSPRRASAGAAALAGLFTALLFDASESPDEWLLSIACGGLVFIGGSSLSGQQAGTGAVARTSGDPVVAALPAMIGGAMGLSLVIALAAVAGGLSQATLPGLADHWYLYLGGPLGAFLTVTTAWAVGGLGTFALNVLATMGQLLTAVLLDLTFNVPVGAGTYLAVMFVTVAALLANSPSATAGESHRSGERKSR
ncbi:MAG: DMT family transporter [Propionibacteriaceae bacterium]|nr:DMT family transporter [Propionibacteriaceae bacterium]